MAAAFCPGPIGAGKTRKGPHQTFWRWADIMSRLDRFCGRADDPNIAAVL
jgi:hypothetical protein